MTNLLLKCHLLALFFFGIIPIELVCTPLGLESYGHSYILPSSTSLSRCCCIIFTWLKDEFLLGTKQSCCILLNPIRNPYWVSCRIYATNCLSKCADSSRAHLSGLRGLALMCLAHWYWKTFFKLQKMWQAHIGPIDDLTVNLSWQLWI